MKRLSHIALAVCTLFCLLSLPKTVWGSDSTRVAYNAMLNTQEKVEKGLELTQHFIAGGDLEDAIYYAKKTRDLAIALNDTPGMAQSFFDIGLISFRTLRPYDEISINFLKSISLFETLDDSATTAFVYLQQGLVDYSIGDFKEATKYFKGTIRFLPNGGITPTARYLLGLTYSETGDFDKAHELLERSLTEYVGESAERRVMVNTFIGKLKFNEGRYAEGVALLEKAIKEYPDQEDSLQLASPRAYLSQGYLKLGRIDEAIIAGESALKFTNINSGVIYWTAAAKSLHRALAQKGNMDRAYEILNGLTQLTDSISGSRVLERITSQKAKYSFEKEMLKAKSKQDLEYQIELRQQQRMRDIGLGSSALALLLAFGFFSRWRFVRRAKNIIERERDRSENLLLNILPEEVANELKDKGHADAKQAEDVSILFTDFKEFTQQAERMNAAELVDELNYCFKAFDEICERHRIEKIKTIGDSYMAAGGLLISKENSAKDTVYAALEMAEFIIRRNMELKREGKDGFQMRSGVHTGTVVAGIIGTKKFQFDIWGDTVNIASRMESYGEIKKVNISQATYDKIKADKHLSFHHRGKISAKGKGEVDMYFVERK